MAEASATKKKPRASDAKKEVATIADAFSAEATSRNTSLPTWTALDPAQLGTMLRQFDRGDYRASLPYFESALRYDAHVKSCADKRFSAVSGMVWEIQFVSGNDEGDEDAKRQFSVVKDFFDALKFSTLDRRDMRQGVAALIEWTLSAACYGYSAAAAEFEPAITSDGVPTYHARFVGVPLRYFEARDRVLKLRRSWWDYSGEELAPGEWCVGVYGKAPLVSATMVLYMLKTTPLEDWTHAVERFGTPFVIVKTPAKRGDANWAAAREAVKQIGSNFSGVFGKDVEIAVESLAQQGAAPHSALIDYLDRCISVLWRGGDMATQSRADNAVGGVEAQGDERDAVTAADAAFVEEVFDTQIVQPILRRVFGDGVAQKVMFRFAKSKRENVSVAAAKLTAAREAGLEVSKAWAYDALGIEPPKEGEETLTFPQREVAAMNARDVLANADGKSEGERIGESKDAQWKEFLLALAELRETKEEEFSDALKAFQRRFPELADEVLSRNDAAELLAEVAVEKMRKEAEATK